METRADVTAALLWTMRSDWLGLRDAAVGCTIRPSAGSSPRLHRDSM
jgi:hypothetical protein